MIITDDFVFIHVPKTGGSFVTKVLRSLYNRRAPRKPWDRWYNRWLGDGSFQERGKHNPCKQIPLEHRDKPIFSIIRHPFERYVSQFYFGWWRTQSERYCDVEKVRRRWPHFPDLSFEEFVRLACTEFGPFFNSNLGYEGNHGLYSQHVVRFYFKDPRHVYHEIDDTYLEGRRWNDDMFDVQFLHTGRLNRELYAFLSELGYPEDKLQFIREMEKVRPKKQIKDRGDTSVGDLFTPELKEYVRRKDRLIFSMFSEFEDQYA